MVWADTTAPTQAGATALAAARMARTHLYDRAAMVRRNPARYLAPIALAATIAGTYLVVHSAVTSKPSHATSQASTRGRRPRGKYARSRFYIVQPGDSLSTISVKTGVSVQTLQNLNPTVDPSTLQPTQRLRLRR
jgi:hypothetical protein